MKTHQIIGQSIFKLGRYYHVRIDGKEIGRRRSKELASKLYSSFFFKPVSKFKGAMNGEIGRVAGFRFIESTG